MAKSAIPVEALEQSIGSLPPCRGFRAALLNYPGLSLIAEVKKASPSEGVIRADFDPVSIAEAYVQAGAQALSVLTDWAYFQGSPAFLASVREAVSVPLLRKDFIEDRYQVLEARAWGADAILLIVAALEKGLISDLSAEAKELGMDVLVEVHDAAELDVALELGCDLIGVNNRNLQNFVTTLETTERLLPRIGPNAVAVSESGIHTHADCKRVERAGAKAVLIGTAFCASPDIGGKVLEVMGR